MYYWQPQQIQFALLTRWKAFSISFSPLVENSVWRNGCRVHFWVSLPLREEKSTVNIKELPGNQWKLWAVLTFYQQKLLCAQNSGCGRTTRSYGIASTAASPATEKGEHGFNGFTLTNFVTIWWNMDTILKYTIWKKVDEREMVFLSPCSSQQEVYKQVQIREKGKAPPLAPCHKDVILKWLRFRNKNFLESKSESQVQGSHLWKISLQLI